MATIIIVGDDELKAKEALMKVLTQEGYDLSGSLEGEEVIRIAKKECAGSLATIKDKVVELENTLFNEKKGILYKSVLKEIEKPLLEQTLKRCEGNQLKASRILGINRNTMRSKIRKLGIDTNRWKTN
ncbi:MAG: helix-turn-helix domain-containing protein [Candidatus Omnitrophota bacterium]|jgi:DNA-binding protein Fis